MRVHVRLVKVVVLRVVPVFVQQHPARHHTGPAIPHRSVEALKHPDPQHQFEQHSQKITDLHGKYTWQPIPHHTTIPHLATHPTTPPSHTWQPIPHNTIPHLASGPWPLKYVVLLAHYFSFSSVQNTGNGCRRCQKGACRHTPFA